MQAKHIHEHYLGHISYLRCEKKKKKKKKKKSLCGSIRGINEIGPLDNQLQIIT
jgi:hypothetical protein